jgi:hypothetical protein
MPSKSKRRSGGGGFKGLVSTLCVLLILGVVLVSFVRVNNITSIDGFYSYFKTWSKYIEDCGAESAEWHCGSAGGGLPPGTGSGTMPPGTGGSSSEDGSSTGNTPGGQPPVTNTSEKLALLDSLTVAEAQEVNYERSEWRHWIGSPCDTRKEILKAQGTEVTTDPTSCKVTGGKWTDPYSLEAFTDASKLDIDHVIPLGYAARHGGNAWSAELKEQFANDRMHLLAVSASENRGKSDKGPSAYMPPNRDFACSYGTIWVTTASKYQLSITDDDKFALRDALQKCG